MASYLLISILLIGILHNQGLLVLAKKCNQDEFLYGEGEIVDEILTCSLSKLFDLDLTHSGDHSKSTSKTLVEQGLSNRTSILHARLSGIWTARRPSSMEAGWRCEKGKVTATAIIELSGLSLEVVEKMEAPMSRHQDKLYIHKPCKTFDLPTWMCRQTKPIYRTVSTWVNKAYYNLTLTQEDGEDKARIASLSSMFTCPETFSQRITHSPSSTYLLSKNSHKIHHQQHRAPVNKRHSRVNHFDATSVPYNHPNSFTTTQSSNMPVSPMYHNSVKVITSEATRVLHSAIDDCIKTLDINLNLVSDYISFRNHKYNLDIDSEGQSDEFSVPSGITNECSNKRWIKNRIELANQVNYLDSETSTRSADGPAKRDQIGLSPPEGPNELLNPYGFYHDQSADQMID